MRLAKADDWSPQHLAPIVPLRRPKRAVTFLVGLAVYGGLVLLGLVATHAAKHAASGQPIAADGCCAATASGAE